MLHRSLFLTSFGFLFFLTVPAQAAVTPGVACPSLGVTQLSDDQVTLVACLKTSPTDATLVWKSMTPLLSYTSNAQSTLSTPTGVPNLNLKTEGTTTGIGPTQHTILGPYDGPGGSPGALYIGAGRKGSDGSRNEIVLYNYGCSGGTCAVPRITLNADLVQASNGLLVGAYGGACTALIGGTLRYNPPTVEFCDGTTNQWRSMGGATGMPAPRIAYASAYAWQGSSTFAQCAANEVLIGGGGSCSGQVNFAGGARMVKSKPENNGWFVSCGSEVGAKMGITSEAYAFCAAR